MKEVVIFPEAYCKIMMHAAKYPHCALNGILLAENNKNDDKPKSLNFVDAIPLFHICLHITPMAEIALSQVEQYAEAKGLVIAGYYLANENVNDMSYERPAHKIADKIWEKFRSSCLFVVDNKLVTLNHDIPAIRTYYNVDGKWKQLDKFKVIIDEETLERTSALLRQKIYYDLVDFDNHLDNISLDWKNVSLNQQIQSILSDKSKKS